MWSTQCLVIAPRRFPNHPREKKQNGAMGNDVGPKPKTQTQTNAHTHTNLHALAHERAKAKQPCAGASARSNDTRVSNDHTTRVHIRHMCLIPKFQTIQHTSLPMCLLFLPNCLCSTYTQARWCQCREQQSHPPRPQWEDTIKTNHMTATTNSEKGRGHPTLKPNDSHNEV